MITGVLLKPSNELGVGGLFVPIKLNNNMHTLAKNTGFQFIKILNQTRHKARPTTCLAAGQIMIYLTWARSLVDLSRI